MSDRADFEALGNTEYDIVVVGGGIFGACAAWDATLRGLKVALVEKSDFCAGVSANSFKMVHGGIRYIQHLDVARVRSSCRERSAFLRIAPHLVQPLPTLIPTYNSLRTGKLFLGTGMYLYDALTFDRNRRIPEASRRIPWSRFLSRDEMLSLYPGVPAKGLTGAAIFCDAQMYSPTRLVWSFLESAMKAGAAAVNYCRATRLVLNNGKVTGCVVRDELSGRELTIKARGVLNAAGPWAEEVFAKDLGRSGGRRGVYSRDAYFVINRRFSNPYAVAVSGESTDADALLGRGARHMFMVPWRDRTLIGVWHRVYQRSADDIVVDDEELAAYIGEINRIYPGMDLKPEDVRIWNAGLVPFGEEQGKGAKLSFGKRSLIIDHQKVDGIGGLVSLIGIRYTMGRGDAQRAVDRLCRNLGLNMRRPQTDYIPLAGGNIENFEQLVASAKQAAGDGVDAHVVRALVHNHGTLFQRVLASTNASGEGLKPVCEDTAVTAAELRYVARHEKVHTLADAVMRRTDLAAGGHPGEKALAIAGAIVGAELGWGEARIAQEVAAVTRALSLSGAACVSGSAD